MPGMENPAAWSQFGPLGLVIGALFISLWKQHQSTREERREWIQAYQEQAAKYDARQAETNMVIRELTATMAQVVNERATAQRKKVGES